VSVDERYVLDLPGSVHGCSSSCVQPCMVKLDEKYHYERGIAHCNRWYALGWPEKMLWGHIRKVHVLEMVTYIRA
jgi:hypothetical protein